MLAVILAIGVVVFLVVIVRVGFRSPGVRSRHSGADWSHSYHGGTYGDSWSDGGGGGGSDGGGGGGGCGGGSS